MPLSKLEPVIANPDSLIFGLSQPMMEGIVIIGVIAVVLGAIFVMLWKQIVIGIMVVCCVAVMANHKPNDQVTQTQKQIEIIGVDPAPIPEVKKQIEIEERSIYSNERP